MELLIVSFVAGILTVLAPCILPLLPVIVGGSIVRSGDATQQKNNWFRPIVIALSLGISVVIFSLLLKATTSLLGVPQMLWQSVSGVIVFLLGLNFLFPNLWEKFIAKTKLATKSNQLLGSGIANNGLAGDVLIGLALGPVFSSCSPTYGLIVATILPATFLAGLTYLVAYSVGLSLALLVIAYLGQSAITKIGWLNKPNGWFYKLIGVLFMIVGLSVLLGLDKDLQAFVLDRGWYDPISNIEESLR